MFRSIRWRTASASSVFIFVCILAVDACVSGGQIHKTAIWGALVSAFLSLSLVLLILRSPAITIRNLTRLSKEMSEGKFDQDIQIAAGDELGELARSLNLTAANLKESLSSITAERDRLGAVLSHLNDGIIVVNNTKELAIINRAAEEILQISSDKAVGRTFAEVVRDYELDAILQRCIKTRRQQVKTVETSPERRFLGVIATPLKEAPGCLFLIRDLTEFHRLETMRRDFVSNISHELRTPISSLKALAETLQEGAIDDQAVAMEFLGKINAEVDRLAQMVQELGELSRIEGDEVPFEITNFDISAAIRRAVERLSAQADRAGLTIEMKFQPDMPEVMADQERVEQVLINLIHNAVKFTPPGGKITISVRDEDNKVLVSVSDTGIGIPADDLPRIFERFYKADKARSGGGTGLGLAIAKHIIEGHGGRIWTESVEGKGSTFNFTLPKVQRPPSSPK